MISVSGRGLRSVFFPFGGAAPDEVDGSFFPILGKLVSTSIMATRRPFRAFGAEKRAGDYDKGACQLKHSVLGSGYNLPLSRLMRPKKLALKLQTKLSIDGLNNRTSGGWRPATTTCPIVANDN